MISKKKQSEITLEDLNIQIKFITKDIVSGKIERTEEFMEDFGEILIRRDRIAADLFESSHQRLFDYLREKDPDWNEHWIYSTAVEYDRRWTRTPNDPIAIRTRKEFDAWWRNKRDNSLT